MQYCTSPEGMPGFGSMPWQRHVWQRADQTSIPLKLKVRLPSCFQPWCNVPPSSISQVAAWLDVSFFQSLVVKVDQKAAGRLERLMKS